MVGVAGFEPATTRTPSVCATRLRHAPTFRRLDYDRVRPPASSPTAASCILSNALPV